MARLSWKIMTFFRNAWSPNFSILAGTSTLPTCAARSLLASTTLSTQMAQGQTGPPTIGTLTSRPRQSLTCQRWSMQSSRKEATMEKTALKCTSTIVRAPRSSLQLCTLRPLVSKSLRSSSRILVWSPTRTFTASQMNSFADWTATLWTVTEMRTTTL